MKKDIPSRVLEGIADLLATYDHCADEIRVRVGVEAEALCRLDVMIPACTINDLKGM